MALLALLVDDFVTCRTPFAVALLAAYSGVEGMGAVTLVGTVMTAIAVALCHVEIFFAGFDVCGWLLVFPIWYSRCTEG